MKTASVADVKAHLSAYLGECAEGPVVITRNGKPVAALVPVTDDEQLENLLLSYSPRLRRLLEERAEEIRRTGGIPHDEFWKMVEAEHESAPAEPA